MKVYSFHLPRVYFVDKLIKKTILSLEIPHLKDNKWMIIPLHIKKPCANINLFE